MIALEIIYDAPIRQLYAGVFETVEQTVARQIDVMKKELTSCPTCDRIENQLVVLDNILKSINR